MSSGFDGYILSPGGSAQLRPGRRLQYIDWLLMGGCILTAILFVLSDGSLAAAIGFVAFIAMIVATLYRVEYGFYTLIAITLLADQYAVPGDEPLTHMLHYFTNLNANPRIPGIPIVAAPVELHLFFLILVWLTVISFRKDVHFVRVQVWFAATLFFLWLIVGFAWGQATRGEFIPGLWETRALFYFGFMYVFVPQVIRTRKQLEAIIWICIGAISAKAFQGIMRFVGHGFSFAGERTLTNHEDPVFIITLLLLLIGLVFFGGHDRQRKILLWLLPFLMWGYYTALRRATYVSLTVSLLAYYFLLPRRAKMILLKTFAVVVMSFAIYLGAFWNSTAPAGLIAQQVKFLVTNDPNVAKAMGSEDYNSGLYRKWEDYNLAQTFKRSPLVGIGFGVKYDMPLFWLGIDQVTYLIFYLPHNQIYWMAVKVGAAGYFAFFFFLNSFILRGASIFSRLKDPYLKSVAAVSIIAIINQCVVSYFDMQLAWARNMIYLGLLMGLLPVLRLLDQQQESSPIKN